LIIQKTDEDPLSEATLRACVGKMNLFFLPFTVLLFLLVAYGLEIPTRYRYRGLRYNTEIYSSK
jgi:hypothetical protein